MARLIRDEPQVVSHIERISIIGGAIGFGDEPDTNFVVDPVAAWLVLQSGIPTILVPFDVTRTTHLSER
ncbi:nucleoside hydrolase [Bifidobacterium asteroides]|uniref:nucleoside hydrolase n=1 Tax=Bifidobacterium asteroides TaxID=1684 RepID=UPI0034A04CD2